jgi:hypothetical protein
MKVHFLHIGKTGGTAVKHALKPYVAPGPYQLILHDHRTHLDHIPKGEKFFFFVRDPVKRFVSGFYSRKRQGRPRLFIPWDEAEREAFLEFETPQQLADALGAHDNEKRARAEKAMRSIRHVRSSYWQWFHSEEYFLHRAEEDLFFCGQQENLERDFVLLCIELKLPSIPPLPADEVKAHKNPSHFEYELSPSQNETMVKWYWREYQFFDVLSKVTVAEAKEGETE